MKKGAGLAVLAIASIYLNRKRIEKRNSLKKVRSELTPTSDDINEKKSQSTGERQQDRRKSPVDIIREQDLDVFVVGNGTKYHINENCRGIRKSSELKNMKLYQAREKGYTLCKWESERGE